VGGSEFLDHAEFNVINGTKSIHKLVEKGVETVAGFVAEQDASGGEAVAQSILR
jgi:hypothetical protein